MHVPGQRPVAVLPASLYAGLGLWKCVLTLIGLRFFYSHFQNLHKAWPVAAPRARFYLAVYIALQVADEVRAVARRMPFSSHIHHWLTALFAFHGCISRERVRLYYAIGMSMEISGPIYLYLDWLRYSGLQTVESTRRVMAAALAVTCLIRIPINLAEIGRLLRDLHLWWTAPEECKKRQIQPIGNILVMVCGVSLLTLDFVWLRGRVPSLRRKHM